MKCLSIHVHIGLRELSTIDIHVSLVILIWMHSPINILGVGSTINGGSSIMTLVLMHLAVSVTFFLLAIWIFVFLLLHVIVGDAALRTERRLPLPDIGGCWLRSPHSPAVGLSCRRTLASSLALSVGLVHIRIPGRSAVRIPIVGSLSGEILRLVRWIQGRFIDVLVFVRIVLVCHRVTVNIWSLDCLLVIILDERILIFFSLIRVSLLSPSSSVSAFV